MELQEYINNNTSTNTENGEVETVKKEFVEETESRISNKSRMWFGNELNHVARSSKEVSNSNTIPEMFLNYKKINSATKNKEGTHLNSIEVRKKKKSEYYSVLTKQSMRALKKNDMLNDESCFVFPHNRNVVDFEKKISCYVKEDHPILIEKGTFESFFDQKILNKMKKEKGVSSSTTITNKSKSTLEETEKMKKLSGKKIQENCVHSKEKKKKMSQTKDTKPLTVIQDLVTCEIGRKDLKDSELVFTQTKKEPSKKEKEKNTKVIKKEGTLNDELEKKKKTEENTKKQLNSIPKIKQHENEKSEHKENEKKRKDSQKVYVRHLVKADAKEIKDDKKKETARKEKKEKVEKEKQVEKREPEKKEKEEKEKKEKDNREKVETKETKENNELHIKYKTPRCLRKKNIKCPFEYKQVFKGKHGIINYDLKGKESSVLVITFHGLNGTNLTFSEIQNILIRYKYQVLNFDLYGYGLSSCPKYSHRKKTYNVEFYISQTEELLDHLNYKDKKYLLIGFSMGCIIATAFANKYMNQTKKLVLISPVGMLEKKPILVKMLNRFPCIINALPYVVFPCFISKKKFKKGNTENDMSEYLYNRIMWQLFVKKNITHSILGCLNNLKIWDAHDIFKEVGSTSLPVLILCGGNDHICKPVIFEKIANAFMNSHMIVFENASHLVVVEKHLELIACLLTFLHFPDNADLSLFSYMLPIDKNGNYVVKGNRYCPNFPSFKCYLEKLNYVPNIFISFIDKEQEYELSKKHKRLLM